MRRYQQLKASIGAKGVYTRKKNLLDAINEDQTGTVEKRFPLHLIASTIVAVFDEPVDSLTGATIGNYQIDGGKLPVINAITMAPLFNITQLRLNSPLSPGTVYNLTVNTRY